MSISLRAAAIGAAMSIATAGQSAVVGFGATVVNTCLLTITTPGALAPSASGTVLSSEETNGLDAVMTVVSSGTSPTISFAAPTLTGPAASTAGATKEIAFTSTGGANQGFVSTLVNYVLGRLNDTLTIKGRVTNAGGFVSGAYLLSTVVTCQQ